MTITKKELYDSLEESRREAGLSSIEKRFMELDLKFDLGGHHYNTSYLKEGLAGKIAFNLVWYMEVANLSEFESKCGEYCENLTTLVEKGDGLHREGIWSYDTTCYVCGESIGTFLIKGGVVTAIDWKTRLPLKCEYPNGLPPYSVELNVPSGKMLVANVLSQFYPDTPEYQEKRNKKEYSVNHDLGIKKSTEMLAKSGCVTLFTTNGACNMYEIGEGAPNNMRTQGEFVMGGYLNEDSWGNEGFKAIGGLKEVANVCTDFWGYMVADLEDAKSRGFDEKEFDFEFNIVDCEAGVYRFTHQFHQLKNSDADIYTYIKRIK